MEFVSSDTNIWIDFLLIDRLYLPFKLPFTYLMNSDAFEDELLNPSDFKDELLLFGLQKVEIDQNELLLAQQYGQKYRKLSVFDRIALAIAKNRSIILMTGDNQLRKAAKNECVKFIGTLGILDKLYDSHFIPIEEYVLCLEELRKKNGGQIRLPESEIENRLANAKTKTAELKIEHSYGAVVFKENQVLIEHMIQGHISIPKGHVEGNETPTETALREIKEETNLEVDLDTRYEYKTCYSPAKGVIKYVSFFVATYKSGEIIPQKEEVTKIEFMELKRALPLVTYDSDKEAIRGAYNYLYGKMFVNL